MCRSLILFLFLLPNCCADLVNDWYIYNIAAWPNIWGAFSCFDARAVTNTNTGTGLMQITGSYVPSAEMCQDYNTNGTIRNGPYTLNYSGGQISTKVFNFQYGALTARIKFPAGNQGPWAAFWLLGSNCQQTYPYTSDNIPPCNWPNAGSEEIDVAETFPRSPQPLLNQQIHYSSNNPGCQLTESTSPSVPDPSAAFHTYGIVWAAGSLSWTIDGVTTCTVTGATVPDHPMFLLLDFALQSPVNNAVLPQTIQVDWVRMVCSTGSIVNGQACAPGTTAFDEEFSPAPGVAGQGNLQITGNVSIQ